MTATMHDPRTDLEILADAYRAGTRFAVTLSAGDLKRAVTLVKPALSRYSYGHPALRQLRLDSSVGLALRVTGSDLDLTAHADTPAQCTGRGVVLIDPKALADTLKGIKAREQVTLTQSGDGDTLEVVRPDGGGRTIRCGQLDEYPRLPTLEPLGDPLELDPAVWSYLASAASTDEQRPALTGIMVDTSAEPSVLVATDSYRLHHHELDGPAPFHALISARTIRAALKSKAPFAVYVTREQGASRREVTVVACPDVTYIGRVIDADFPNWRQLIPTATVHALEIDGHELARVLRTFPDGDESAAAAIRVSCADRQVVLEQRSPATATATVDVDGCRYWPESMMIAFNRPFLADLVDIDGTITLHATDHLKPIKATDQNGRIVGLLMPVRTT